jgi:hypothetical protein
MDNSGFAFNLCVLIWLVRYRLIWHVQKSGCEASGYSSKMNRQRTVKVESRVKLDKEGVQTGFAIFRATQHENHVLVYLDLAPEEPDTDSIRFHLSRQALLVITETHSELVYRNVGQPIDISDYIHLPEERRGFRLL